MKKALSLVIVFAMIISALIVVFPSGAVSHGFLRGDSNDDSKVTMKDVLLLRRYLAGLVDPHDINLPASDVKFDSKVNSKDILLLRRILAGIDVLEENNTDGLYRIDEIKLGGRNIARYSIIVPESVPENKYCLTALEYSAGELKRYINEACGVSLNLTHSDNDSYHIEYRFDLDDEYDLGKEGFVLELAENGDFIITCGTTRGAVYATYTFLEDLIGYRFLTENITYLYKNSKIDVPNGYFDRQVPTAEYRGIGMNAPGNNYPALKVNASDGGADRASKGDAYKLGGAVGTTYIHAHSFVYFKAGFEHRNDPDLDSIGGGEQLCMTDEATYDKVIDFLYKLVEWRMGPEVNQVPGFHFTQLSCSANDNGNFCQCNDCKKVYREEGSMGGALIRLCNRVVEKFCADYPMLEIYTAAYAGCHVPPRMTRPDPRLNICFCCSGCNNHSLRNTEECDACGGNTRLYTTGGYGQPDVPQNNGIWMRYLDQWLELTDNVWYWYYTVNFSFYVSPAANLFDLYDDVKFLAEKGVKGFYLEGTSDNVNYNYEQLRIYLATRIMWDPEMTEEEYVAYMNEYLSIYYGPGWEKIRRCIDLENEAGNLAGCWTNNFEWPWDASDKAYYRDHYDEMAQLYDEAYDLAETDDQRTRVERSSVHVHFMGLSSVYQRDWVNGTYDSQAKYRERYEWLWNYYNSHPRMYALNTNFVGAEGTVGAMWSFPTSASEPRDPMNWLLDGGDFTGSRLDG